MSSSRMIYVDEGEPGSRSFDQWYAAFRRSVKSEKGQQALRRLRDALLALPAKRLERGTMALNGTVCAIGALQAHSLVSQGTAWEDAIKALDHGPDGWDGHDTVAIARRFGFSETVGWEIVELNDDDDQRCDSPPGTPRREVRYRPTTPEERYEAMLKWVNDHIVEEGA